MDERWRAREVAAIDEALTRYLANRAELNRDGQGAERDAVVDQALELRLRNADALAVEAMGRKH